MRALRPFLLSALMLVPVVASAAAPTTFSGLVSQLVTILNAGVGVVIVFTIVVYFYGISSNILTADGESRQKLRSYLIWGILILFVMVSIWGILKLLQATIFTHGGDSGNGSASQSQSPNSFGAPQFQPTE